MNPEDISVQDELPIKDIHLPLSPEQWPPAPGWWLLAFLGLLLFAWAVLRLFRRWQRYRVQKEILMTLDALQREHDAGSVPEFLAEVSILLRRVAMMKFPHQQVAALTGKGWLSFLDLHGGNGEYANGVGQVLSSGPYVRDGEVDKDALLLLTKQWIKRNTR